MGNTFGNSQTKTFTCKNCCKVCEVHDSMMDPKDPTYGYCTRCSIRIISVSSATGAPANDNDKINHLKVTILSNDEDLS